MQTSLNWRTACHEAGHAVAGILYGLPLVSVELGSDPRAIFDFSGVPDMATQRVIMALAGPAADHWSAKWIVRPEDDRLLPAVEAARGHHSPTGDYNKSISYIVNFWPPMDDDGVLAVLRELEASAISTVKAQWPAINSVAAELIITRKATGLRVREIVGRFVNLSELEAIHANAYQTH